MPEPRNFMLGHGESLVAPIAFAAGGGETQWPYTADEARERLLAQVEAAVHAFEALPAEARPADRAVGLLTLHPQFIAKSYHPGALLRELGLAYIGSRAARITPDRWTLTGEPSMRETSELFVAASLATFRAWRDRLSIPNSFPENSQIKVIERFRAPSPSDKKRGTSTVEGDLPALEVVLHLPQSEQAEVLRAFEPYARSCGAQLDPARRVTVSQLGFIPLRLPPARIDLLARFAFLRVLRPVPALRTLDPVERSVVAAGTATAALPRESALDPNTRIAVFDGGLPADSPLSPWAANLDAGRLGPPVPAHQQHGHSVTSAALFGPLTPGKPAPRPYARVDHYRVLDDTVDDPYQLYTTLQRILSVLERETYQFASLSVGPAYPIEDDEVHLWTAALDEHLSRKDTLLTVAAGNNGENDRPSGNARVQIPSDCVNALAVGSADSRGTTWKRAPYSAVGPGRSPGMMKPDIVNFGGCAREPFYFAPPRRGATLLTGMGTSFSSPAALRMATAIRAHFGEQLSPLALRALLIHCADQQAEPADEAGWGRISLNLEDYVVCAPESVRVLYQGAIEPGGTVRMQIPLPPEVTTGRVQITATYCTTAPVDPRTPNSYTGSAIEPVFRPHSQRISSERSTHASSDTFFQLSDYASEAERRRGALKWETSKHKTVWKLASSLHEPVFDVHHTSRIEQLPGNGAQAVRYALVVTLRCTDYPDIYNQVVRQYAGRLEVLRPRIDIPVTVQGQI